MKNGLYLIPVLLIGIGSSVGCNGSRVSAEGQRPSLPAKVENRGMKEADLATIILTKQAEQRLGIEITAVEFQATESAIRQVGEIVLPPGRVLTVSAPIAGTIQAATESAPTIGAKVKAGQLVFRLLPLLPVQRDLRVTAEAEALSAQSRMEAAKIKVARAERMLQDRVGSQRAWEDAHQELKLAETSLQAAGTKLDQLNRSPLEADVIVPIPAPQNGILRQIYVGSGQVVTSGAALFEIADLDEVWIRVPIYVGDISRVMMNTPVKVQAWNGGRIRPAKPAPALPSADPANSTADLFYQLDNRDMSWRPGEKVSVILSSQGQESRLQIPWSAILLDVHGSAWLYENTAPQTYVRYRIEVDRVLDGTAILVRGPKPGAKVVSTGAAELYGTEFGAGK